MLEENSPSPGDDFPWRRKIRSAPAGPGVYLMKDGSGNVLYVGKAKSLRARLRSYLDPGQPAPRTAAMLSRVDDVEVLVTDSELEALILENSLIKKCKPKYNVTLRDDKTYPFLRLSVQEDFPTLTVVRRPADDGARYFGPYVPAGAMRRTLRLLQRTFPLRRCRGPLRTSRRPCLNYQMGRCMAPCAGRADRTEYGRVVREVSLFLQGRGGELTASMRRRMQELSRQERFEEAALLRDRITAIQLTLERQKVHLAGKGDMDIVGAARLGDRMAFVVLHAKKGRIVGARTFRAVGGLQHKGGEHGVESVLRRLYDGREPVPPLILVPEHLPGEDVMLQWLQKVKGGPLSLRVPRSGALRALVAMASRNALRLLEEEGPAADEVGRVLEDLASEAGSGVALRSIAAVDVSAISGTDPVAALVWWEEGRFVRGKYRRFLLSDEGGADDYAMMAEAVGRLARRVGDGDWDPPDVLMLDGGRGQLSAGRRALRGLPWRPALLLAIAKPRESRLADLVYSEGREEPLGLQEGSSPLRLLQSVRDEAHRFALQYHRRRRGKRIRGSALDGVPGLGPARRKKVLSHFGSLTRLKAATLDEISAVPGIPGAVAREIHRRLGK